MTRPGGRRRPRAPAAPAWSPSRPARPRWVGARLRQSFQRRPVPSRDRPATMRWSRTVMPPNSSIRWNVRPSPRRARRYRGYREMSVPSNMTLPWSGCSMPSRQLKNVVLPAPFGPMSPTASPASTSTETSSSALMPAKRFEMPRASSSVMASRASWSPRPRVSPGRPGPAAGSRCRPPTGCAGRCGAGSPRWPGASAPRGSPPGAARRSSAPRPKSTYCHSSEMPTCFSSSGNRASAKPATTAPSTVRTLIVTTSTSHTSPKNGE